MKNERLAIYGMTCEHCVKTVTRILSKLNGVHAVSVSLPEHSAQVEYDETIVSHALIDAALRAEDFSLSPLPEEEPAPAACEISAPETTELHETQLKISGMHCANCALTIEKHLSQHTGINSVHVDALTEKMTVQHQNNVDTSQLIKAVKEAGYGAETLATNTMQLNLAISGMTCANCAQTIEKVVSKLAGVQKIAVNLPLKKALIEYDPEQISETNLIQAIQHAGYGAETTAQNRIHTQSSFSKEKLLFGLACVNATLVLMLSYFSPFSHTQTNGLLFGLATLSQFGPGWIFYRGAYYSLRNKATNMDVLVSLGISAAYFFSVYSFFFIDPMAHTFFDSSALIIAFILLGKVIENNAKAKTSAALEKLFALQADKARRLQDGHSKVIALSDIDVDDVLQVQAGEKIPVDGIVLEGQSSIDESLLTGEAMPRLKAKGDTVAAGTLNQSGLLTFRATRVGKDTLLSQIIRLVEQAQADKAPIQRVADRISNVFVPVVVVAAICTFCVWYFSALPVAEGYSRFLFSMQLMIAVLVIACPCALGLATPTAIMVGSTAGLRRGILFKKGSVLEKISKLSVMLLDKTGTLTEGRPTLVHTLALHEEKTDILLQLAASVEQHSSHPLAKALTQAAQAQSLTLFDCSDVKEFRGQGSEAHVNGQRIRVGRLDFVSDKPTDIESLQKKMHALNCQGHSLVYLANEQGLLGVLTLFDRLKTDSALAIQAFTNMGIKTLLISGDNHTAVAEIARQAGINEALGEVTPADKIEQVVAWQKQGAQVAMVGDGINDAPALAQADIGIAIGSGADVAKETGDVVLINNSLMDVVRAIQLGKLTLRTIKQNFFWAFFYNLAMIPLAAGLLYPAFGLVLKPEWACIAMWLSSLTVVCNSLLLTLKAKQIFNRTN